MKATFEIYCPEVRAKLNKLMREHDMIMHPVDEDGWSTDLPQHVNPIQYFGWGKWNENSSILYVSGHRCALTSEGVRVMRALRAAEEAGKASLLEYQTSMPVLAWYETHADHMLRQPVGVRIDWYASGATWFPWDIVFADLVPVAGQTPAQIWASYPAAEARAVLRALALR